MKGDRKSGKSLPPGRLGELQQVLEDLRRQLWHVREEFCVWSRLANFLAARKDLWTGTPMLWQMLLDGLKDSVILLLSRIVDRHKDAAGLGYCLSLLMDSRWNVDGRSKEDVAAYVEDKKRVLDALRNRYQAIEKIRDKQLAHTDRMKYLNPEQLQEETATTGGELYGLILELILLVREVQKFVDGTGTGIGRAFNAKREVELVGDWLERGWDSRKAGFGQPDQGHIDWLRQGRVPPLPSGVQPDPDNWEITKKLLGELLDR
ncbi:MAG TPA: hypothetical protein VGO93_16590 [Candidatus Xenobia bacterium]|jgi:hypothetical protein